MRLEFGVIFGNSTEIQSVGNDVWKSTKKKNRIVLVSAKWCCGRCQPIIKIKHNFSAPLVNWRDKQKAKQKSTRYERLEFVMHVTERRTHTLLETGWSRHRQWKMRASRWNIHRWLNCTAAKTCITSTIECNPHPASEWQQRWYAQLAAEPYARCGVPKRRHTPKRQRRNEEQTTTKQTEEKTLEHRHYKTQHCFNTNTAVRAANERDIAHTPWSTCSRRSIWNELHKWHVVSQPE